MTWSTTRDGMHSAAEWLLSGPQYVDRTTIRLRIQDDGIATLGGERLLNEDGLTMRTDGGSVTVAWGPTIRHLANAAAFEPTMPTGVYDDHGPLGPDDALDVDPADVRRLLQWFVLGRDALQSFAAEEEPVLWPEHFDLAITHAEVNFGVSAGDGFHPSCYAYVGPWHLRDADFWNAPFGAFCSAEEVSDVATMSAFFSEGATAAADQDR